MGPEWLLKRYVDEVCKVIVADTSADVEIRTDGEA